MQSLNSRYTNFFHSDTLRKKSTKKNPDIRGFFIDSKMYSLHKEDARYSLRHNEYIQFQS